MIFDVGDLCYIDTVLWSDIFSSDNSTIKYAATGQANSCNGFILAFIQYFLWEVNIRTLIHRNFQSIAMNHVRNLMESVIVGDQVNISAKSVSIYR